MVIVVIHPWPLIVVAMDNSGRRLVVTIFNNRRRGSSVNRLSHGLADDDARHRPDSERNQIVMTAAMMVMPATCHGRWRGECETRDAEG